MGDPSGLNPSLVLGISGEVILGIQGNAGHKPLFLLYFLRTLWLVDIRVLTIMSLKYVEWSCYAYKYGPFCS